MNNELLLITGEDIPFIEAQVNIHQPIMSEISLIGEENFFAGCHFLNFSKNKFISEDKSDLEDKSDFEIFMSIMCSKDKIEYKNSVFMLLALLFPDYQIRLTGKEILLASEKNTTRINKENYDIFRDIIDSMFGLSESEAINGDYNPADRRAAKIAEKIKKSKEKIAKIKGQTTQKVAIFSFYISVLSVGLQKDMNSFKNYTVFQLKDEFKRFQKKQSFDMYVEAKKAGAQDIEEVENWMIDIHP